MVEPGAASMCAFHMCLATVPLLWNLFPAACSCCAVLYTTLAANRPQDINIGVAICDKFQIVHFANRGNVGGELGRAAPASRVCRQINMNSGCLAMPGGPSSSGREQQPPARACM